MSRAGRLVAAVLLALAASGCGGREEDAGARARTGPPDLLLITVDTFRADRAGCYGHPGGLTPSLDRALRNGMIARDAFAPAPLTAVSHASMLTGLEPPRHGVRDNGAFPLAATMPNLVPLLRENGFRTGGFVAAFPLERRFGFDHGFDRFDDTLESPGNSITYYAERPAAVVVDAALPWVRELGPSDRWFLWVHFFDPHHPRRVPAPLRKLPAADDYDREIRGMDHEIGRLLRELAEIAGRSPVTAVVSDHGEALGDHGESSHGILLYEETMRSLFGVAAPAGEAKRRLERGRRDDGDASGWIHEGVVRFADLLPTLCDVLSLSPPEDLDGRSLLRDPDGRGAYGETYYPSIHYAWSPLLAWRDDRWTYVEGPDPELYDRRADPAETRNVIADHPEVASELAARIADLAQDPEAPIDDGLDTETREKLLALGYVAGGRGAAIDRRKDPKKLIGSANALFRGITLLSDGNAGAALPFLQRAYRADPENVSTLFHLASCLRTLGDGTTAMSYYRRAIELNPKAADAWAHLALLEFDRGRHDVALELLATGRRHNPKSFPLLMTSGDLQLDLSDPASAKPFFLEAARAEPRRVEPLAQLARVAEQLGDDREASELWARAVDLDRNHPLVPDRIRAAGESR